MKHCSVSNSLAECHDGQDVECDHWRGGQPVQDPENENGPVAFDDLAAQEEEGEPEKGQRHADEHHRTGPVRLDG